MAGRATSGSHTAMGTPGGQSPGESPGARLGTPLLLRQLPRGSRSGLRNPCPCIRHHSAAPRAAAGHLRGTGLRGQQGGHEQDHRRPPAHGWPQGTGTEQLPPSPRDRNTRAILGAHRPAREHRPWLTAAFDMKHARPCWEMGCRAGKRVLAAATSHTAPLPAAGPAKDGNSASHILNPPQPLAAAIL